MFGVFHSNLHFWHFFVFFDLFSICWCGAPRATSSLFCSFTFTRADQTFSFFFVNTCTLSLETHVSLSRFRNTWRTQKVENLIHFCLQGIFLVTAARGASRIMFSAISLLWLGTTRVGHLLTLHNFRKSKCSRQENVYCRRVRGGEFAVFLVGHRTDLCETSVSVISWEWPLTSVLICTWTRAFQISVILYCDVQPKKGKTCSCSCTLVFQSQDLMWPTFTPGCGYQNQALWQSFFWKAFLRPFPRGGGLNVKNSVQHPCHDMNLQVNSLWLATCKVRSGLTFRVGSRNFDYLRKRRIAVNFWCHWNCLRLFLIVRCPAGGHTPK